MSEPSEVVVRPPEPAVLVVGAGPTGLTLACEPARLDVSFRRVEANASLRHGKVVGIAGSAVGIGIPVAPIG